MIISSCHDLALPSVHAVFLMVTVLLLQCALNPIHPVHTQCISEVFSVMEQICFHYNYYLSSHHICETTDITLSLMAAKLQNIDLIFFFLSV